MWIIKDWMGEILFDHEEFVDFEDAEEYLCEFFRKNAWDYEEYRQEYNVEEKC